MPGLNATHFFIRCGVILVCLILVAVYTLAQTGGISGKITDSVGYVVVGAEIKAVISPSDCAAAAQLTSSVRKREIGKASFSAAGFHSECAQLYDAQI
jgi:hypothetical protein